MQTLYLAMYVDNMYPEDNEILGASFDESVAQKLIDDTIEYQSRITPGKHLAEPRYYSIKETSLYCT